MKFSTAFIHLTTALSLAEASSLFRRDANAVLTNIAQIRNQTAVVYADVLAYNGTVNSALTIYNDANVLDSYIQQGASNASASSAFSDADSVRIANAVVTLQPNIFATLQALVDRKYNFTAAVLGFDATGLVESSLTNQRTDTTYFSNNVTAKLSTTLKRLSPLFTSNIDFHFVRAQQAFASPQ